MKVKIPLTENRSIILLPFELDDCYLNSFRTVIIIIIIRDRPIKVFLIVMIVIYFVISKFFGGLIGVFPKRLIDLL